MRTNAVPRVATFAAALLLAGCSSGSTATTAGEVGSAISPEPATVRAQGCPPSSLLPAAITETCGERVGELLFTRLVTYDAETGEARWGPAAGRAMARSITSEDGQRWRIELKDGWTFHDGEPVTARSFASAWNHAAYGPNGHPNAFLFSRIDGFSRVRCTQPACNPPPDERQLRGVVVEDDRTLVVTLSEPNRLFPTMLAHLAFSPLPSQAFEDAEGFAAAPVGNGPYRMEGPWDEASGISVSRFEDYAGAAGRPERVEFVMFDELPAAYQAFLDGELDVLQDLPNAAVGERRRGSGLVERPGDRYTFLVAPAYDDTVQDRTFLRALSMAIDRSAIAEEELRGAAVPARSLIAPVVPTANERGPCSEACRHDPATARELLERSGGWPEQPIRVWFHGTAANRRHVEAVVDEWKRVFGLGDAAIRLQPLRLQEFLAHLEDRQAPGLQFLSWTMDFPSPRNYLEPLHGRGGLLNLDGYEDVQVAAWLDLAAEAGSTADSLRLYQRAEEAILADLHHIPLWFSDHQALHAARLQDVTLDVFGRVRLEDVTIAEEG